MKLADFLRAPALGGALFLGAMSAASAHGVVGNRFFPATINVEDPAVADELALPTASQFKGADAAKETEISAEFAKRITPKLGVSVEGAWTRSEEPGGSSAYGFQNVEIGLKYELLRNVEHEAIVSAGLGYEIGGSGAARVGAEDVSAFSPSLYFGKGLGDLPDALNWAKPFAVTGSLAYEMPTRERQTVTEEDALTGLPVSVVEENPEIGRLGLSLQYSLPYLRAHVKDYGLPEFVNRLVPVVEMSLERPLVRGGGEGTTGVVSPGVLWTGKRMQFGAEALIPVNGDSGKSVGWVFQLHYYLDDIFPHSLGAPIFGGQP